MPGQLRFSVDRHATAAQLNQDGLCPAHTRAEHHSLGIQQFQERQSAIKLHVQALLTQCRGCALQLRGLTLFQEPHPVPLGVKESGSTDAGASQTNHSSGAHHGSLGYLILQNTFTAKLYNHRLTSKRKYPRKVLIQ